MDVEEAPVEIRAGMSSGPATEVIYTHDIGTVVAVKSPKGNTVIPEGDLAGNYVVAEISGVRVSVPARRGDLYASLAIHDFWKRRIYGRCEGTLGG